MNSTPLRWGILCAGLLLFVGTTASLQPAGERGPNDAAAERAVTIQYLEIVTPAVDNTCAVLAEAHGVVFSEPVAALGRARTARLRDGGRIGVRAPLRESEAPVVRPYVLVDDIEAAVKAAVDVGAEVAIPPLEIPGQGTFAIYILGGIDHGLWQQ